MKEEEPEGTTVGHHLTSTHDTYTNTVKTVQTSHTVHGAEREANTTHSTKNTG